MYANFVLFSLFSVIAKFAGQHPLFSFRAIALYGIALVVLGIYAIVWQMVLKWLPLSVAYPNKAVTIVMGMVWGALIFSEIITWSMILGVIVIVGGILVVVRNSE